METGQNAGQKNGTGQVQAPGGTAGQDRTVTVAEAAGLLGLTTEAVRKRLQRGQLAGVKIGGAWLVQLDRTSGPASRPEGNGQDRTTGQRTRPVPRGTKAAAELVEQLRAENAFLRDELQRKDMLLMAFAQGIQRLEAPRSAAHTTQTEAPASSGQPRRRLWRLRWR